MDQSIVPREWMRTRGHKARVEGKGRDDHGMNPGSAAIAEWQAGWDVADVEAERPRYIGNELEAA